MDRRPVQDFFLFLIGGSLFAAGIFLFTNQVMVGSGFHGFGFGRRYGYGRWSGLGSWLTFGVGDGFGLLMIPFGAGVALLFADSYRKLGWFLVWASSAAIGVGILQSLLISFRPASLWSLLSMIVMIAGGAGLMFRSLRGYQEEKPQSRTASDPSPEQGLDELQRELDRLRARIEDDRSDS